jgi:hypothetical protein
MLDFGRLQGEVEVFDILGFTQLRLVVSYRRFRPNYCPETSETNYPLMLFAAFQKIKALSRPLI